MKPICRSREAYGLSLGRLLLLFLVLICAAPPCFSQARAYRVEEGIVYSTIEGAELQLDIAWPTKGIGPVPLIVFLPGNGWGWWQYERRITYYVDVREAAKKGFVAAAVDYRPTSVKVEGKSRYRFPAQIHDVKAAVRWLRTHAGDYGIDTDRVAAVGFSSGGNLALMLGFTNEHDGFEGDGADLSISSAVQAVVSIAGPTELTALYLESDAPQQVLTDLIGATPQESPERYRQASPLTYITKDDPPVLIIQGDADSQVPVRQALLLDQRMNEVGVPHELLILKGGKHENIQLNEDIWRFLSDHLR